MKKSLVLAMAMALGVTASAYAANPFSDVPAGHWAYDSVAELAAAGVVDGYTDGSFGGDKLMTRYEMAQIVAKAMAKGANVDKLAAEFADELDTLGVRVANLEKKADNVKITGEIRYHYADSDAEGLYKWDSKDKKHLTKDGNENKLRSRIWVKGQINDDWSYTGMFENNQDFDNDNGDEDVKFQRAYVNGKLGGVAVQAGRYNAKMAEGNVYDTRFDGVQLSYGKDVKLTAGYGKATPSGVVKMSTIPNGVDPNGYFERDAEEAYYAELTGKVGALALAAGYYSFDEVTDYTNDGKVYDKDDLDVWTLSANYAFDKNFKLGAMYLLGNDEYGEKAKAEVDDDGYVVTASYKGAKASEAGSWGLVAKYYDQGATTYLDHTMNGMADSMMGFKGYSVAANYALAKNIVGQVEYYDLEEKEGNRDAETLWAQVVFTF